MGETTRQHQGVVAVHRRVPVPDQLGSSRRGSSSGLDHIVLAVATGEDHHPDRGRPSAAG